MRRAGFWPVQSSLSKWAAGTFGTTSTTQGERGSMAYGGAGGKAAQSACGDQGRLPEGRGIFGGE